MENFEFIDTIRKIQTWPYLKLASMNMFYNQCKLQFVIKGISSLFVHKAKMIVLEMHTCTRTQPEQMPKTVYSINLKFKFWMQSVWCVRIDWRNMFVIVIVIVAITWAVALAQLNIFVSSGSCSCTTI